MSYNSDPWIRDIYASWCRKITEDEKKALSSDPSVKNILDKIQLVQEHMTISVNLSKIYLIRNEHSNVPDQMYTTDNGETEYVITKRIGRVNRMIVEGLQNPLRIDDETYDRIQMIASGRADPVYKSNFIRTPSHVNVAPGQVYEVKHAIDLYNVQSRGADMIYMYQIQPDQKITVISTFEHGWVHIQLDNKSVGKIPIPEFYEDISQIKIVPTFDTMLFYE